MINRDERKKVIGGDINTFTKQREKRKMSRIYSIPCKKRKEETNQQSEQTNLGIVQQVLPIKNKMIARTYSRGRREKQTHSIKAGVSSLANAHDKRAQKDGSHTTGATNIPRPFFHAHHQQSKNENEQSTTKSFPSKHQQKRISTEKSYLCEQSIKPTKKSIMSSTKRKIGEKLPPIISKRGIRERSRKKKKPTIDLTCGQHKNEFELGPISRFEGGPARKKLSLAADNR